MNDRYAGQWVLLRVTAHDQHHHPIRGQLIAHSPSNRTVCRMLDLALEAPKSPDQPFYLFAASKPLPAGSTPGEAFAALAEEESDRNWQPPRTQR